MVVKLSLDTLKTLPAGVTGPNYDREALSAGIMHFGVGNFHRSHQAVYLDALMNKGLAHDWALVGAGVFTGERKGRDVLQEQDLLTTVVEQEAEKTSVHVTGPMIEFIEPGNTEATIERMVQPDIRIVSLTITEGGYFLNSDQEFDTEHADIKADAASLQSPKTVFGLILRALQLRKEAGVAPFTVMSCDNIPHNGSVARNAVVGLAKLYEPAFASWIEDNVAFPNSMVDRITPATTDRERALLADEFGIEDGWPVFCEDFKQWVMEDNFSNGRPAFEEVGVQFSDQVAAFEFMKLRILNGGHSLLAYPAAMLDIEYVHEAMAHPLIRGFLRKVVTEEVIPNVPPVPGADLNDYFDLIERRFSNPKIADRIQRLCFDGSNKLPKFILPPVQDGVNAGTKINGLALENAIWCRYCAGVTDGGVAIDANDPTWASLQDAAKRAQEDPSVWLAQEAIYGDLAHTPEFQEAFEKWLTAIAKDGVAATLQRFIEGN